MSLLRRVLPVLPWVAALALCAVPAASQGEEGDAPAGIGIWMPVPEGARQVEVTADGEPVGGVVGDELPSWRVVLMFDRLLSEPLTFRNGAVRLAREAERLTRLGPVEVAVLDGEVRPALPPTTDPSALADTLAWLRLREIVEGSQLVVRRELVEELGGGALEPEARTALAEEAASLERQLIQRQMDALLLWAAEQGGTEPKLLLLVSSGFDDPLPFYGELPEVALDRADDYRVAVEGVAQALSGRGWTVMPLVSAGARDALLEGDVESASASDRAIEELEENVEATVLGGDDAGGDAVLFDVLGRSRKSDRKPDGEEAPLLVAPGAPLERLAAATGGRLLLEADDVAEMAGRLASWRRVELDGLGSIPSEVGLAGGTVRRLESAGREALAAARARQALDSGELESPLDLAALVDQRSTEPLLVVEPVGEGWSEARGEVRLAIAVEDERMGARVIHRADPVDGGGWAGWSVPLPIEPGSAPAVAVVAEADGVGGWAVAFAGHVGLGSAPAGYEDVDALLLPAPRTIHLLAPGGTLLLGPTLFRTVVSDPAVRQVDFYVDGEREAVRRTPPYQAELDLGSLPRLRRIEAVALDDRGEELGRDGLIVNGGNAAFQVRLRAPGREIRGGNVSVSGTLTVEAEVQAPRSRRVQRVEFYWRDELLGVESAAPFERAIEIPADDPQGFVRAVAHLVDGASAEDVLFVNTPGSSAALDVTLVQLYVVVTDREGNPVRDLDGSVFHVREEGEPQEIASFSDAAELPLTVGLAVDSSASMFVKLPDVQVAAARFLRDLMEPRDRAFVVGFGGEPRLYRSTTSSLPALTDGIGALAPEGRTAIWKSIVYSLVQLQGVPGKKALIVYSDGADEDPDFSYRTARKFARLIGVPIYVILSNNEIVRTQGSGLNIRGFLNRLEELVDEVGGRVFLTRVGDDLRDVYAQIADELRGQYVLGYYADRAELGEWREVDVEVTVPGLTARSAAGYYQ